ncbi:MAG: helix-turn-helix transcriptional regulator [Bacillus sp. (in: firmicutes)]
MKGYGENIKKYRKLMKLNQEQLGEKVDVTKSFISKLENEAAKPSLEMLVKIANVLEVDIGDLIDNKKDVPQEIKDAGGEWMVLGEQLEKEGITPEQVKQWAEIVKNMTKISE